MKIPHRVRRLLDEDPLLKPDEVARICRVNEGTVREWCRSGHLPAVKVVGSWRIRESEVKKFMKGGTDEAR